MARIVIAPGIAIGEDALEEHFVHASGPGGQNVNKVASAVELRFDVSRSHLPADMRARVAALAGRRLTKDGVLIIDARRHRTQERNRADARARLMALLRAAATPPKPRHATRVPRVEKKNASSTRRRGPKQSGYDRGRRTIDSRTARGVFVFRFAAFVFRFWDPLPLLGPAVTTSCGRCGADHIDSFEKFSGTPPAASPVGWEIAFSSLLPFEPLRWTWVAQRQFQERAR